jgi:hypothetical protein
MKNSRALRYLVFGFLLAVVPTVFSSPSQAQFAIGISVRIGPPALPVYEMPLCPGEGYLWTPGYWAWDDDGGYYWVPGTWVEAPEPGLLWTPGYWGWNNGAYGWNEGYWGPEVGFYGGINYGFGYYGSGFGGGEWRSGHFFYNTAVVNVNTTVIRNVYVNKTVIVNSNSHVAFNGGQGGVQARPTAREESYAHEHHTAAVAAQVQQAHAASKNRALFASTNHGRPAIAATPRPGVFTGKGVVVAKAAGGAYKAPAMSPKEARASVPAKGENRPAESHAAQNRAAPKEASHPAPKENRMANPHSTSSHATESRETEKARPASKPRTETEPKAAPRESAPKARESAPKERESAPKARESAPKEKESAPRSEPKARESAPKASKPTPAPKTAPEKKEPAPKPEHKG